MLHPTLSSHHC